ncbi:MAG: dipeptide epimerase [Desulfobacterales bacterium]|jgi:L-alanine-DL-glutamate epimerase-like enolase superfamily enzyme
MKITQAIYWTERLALTRSYTIAYEHIDSVQNFFVQLKTDNGAIGLGVASPAQEVTGEGIQKCRQALADNLENLLIGTDIRYLKTRLRDMESAMPGAPAARAAIDMALHDLWAKHHGLPLVDLLGRVHHSLPTSITIGIGSVEESLKDVAEYMDRGFRILKVKVGRSMEEDVERLRCIRQKAGQKILIRVDANQGYAADQFKHFLKQTASLELEFIEQPLAARDLTGMRRLPEAARKRSAADESLLDARDLIACLEPPRPFGICNIKLMKCGGIAPAMQIAEVAHLAGIDIMWGCMDESIVGIAAALHAALASPATRYLDLDGHLDLAQDLATGGLVIKNGELSVTDRPGLGVEMIAAD